jgi:hypothetical protein
LGEAPGGIVGVNLLGKGAGLFKPLAVDRWDDRVFEPDAFFFFFFGAVRDLFVYEGCRLAHLVVGVGRGHAVGVPLGQHVPFAVIGRGERQFGRAVFVEDFCREARSRTVGVGFCALSIVDFE